jgi:hypothetical protein
MKTVFKYRIEAEDASSSDDIRKVYVRMPKFAEVLHVGWQRGEAFIWALVETTNPSERREFEVYGTGHEIPAGHRIDVMEHLGTWMTGGDRGLVFHLFQRTTGDIGDCE